jgi:hypothetical protein
MSLFRPIVAPTDALGARKPTGTPVGSRVTPRRIDAGFANLALASDLSRLPCP